MKGANLVTGLFLCLLALTGCPNKTSTEAAKGDNPAAAKGDNHAAPATTSTADRSVRIISISPDSDKPLRAGSTVKLAIAVEYIGEEQS